MKKPVIILSGDGFRTSGVSGDVADWTIHKNYAECIRQAGGTPLLAIDPASASDYAESADGLLLTGGFDVDPALYGEPLRFDNVMIDPTRDEIEMALLDAFVQAKKPIFGICRGIQIINTYFGGTLYQDIPWELGSDIHGGGQQHPISIVKASFLHELYGDNMICNSYHHQAVHDLAEAFVPIAFSDANDTKLVEAIAHDSLPIWAVQWHPERMTVTPSSPLTTPVSCEDSAPIFHFFVDQCR